MASANHCLSQHEAPYFNSQVLIDFTTQHKTFSYDYLFIGIKKKIRCIFSSFALKGFGGKSLLEHNSVQRCARAPTVTARQWSEISAEASVMPPHTWGGAGTGLRVASYYDT